MPALTLTRLCVLAALAVVPPLHADCELLFAPANVRARALAFHHANEQRRAAEGRPPVATAGADPQGAGNHGRRGQARIPTTIRRACRLDRIADQWRRTSTAACPDASRAAGVATSPARQMPRLRPR